MTWTDDRIAELRRRWADGESAGRIAGRMGLSRNAVMGKINRLGLSTRRLEAERAKLERRTAPKPVRAWKLAPIPPVDVTPVRAADVVSLNIDLPALEDDSCRYPYGTGAEIVFCGHAKTNDSSYCAAHAKLCAGKGTPSERRAVRDARRTARRVA